MAQFNEIAKRRIHFQTRRGLLELDIVLKRFMENHFQHLSDEELSIFVDILELQDQEFLALVNQVEQPQRTDFIPLLEKIRQT
ncbi:MAG: succinate dehydrogenase assembly factor 2 [Alysiella sp.]|uniref:FAD assembly factor SdhE n=1 Tax=Alysiella sp. TaxID=1872483 RepID=UPI0026DBC399|nr:succinate dehydrogenase assembly factor 2 [Alysiella sp.]MDO4433367.1 succinate dehydrogenase assembly factor 2 [Alysiella sp.]